MKHSLATAALLLAAVSTAPATAGDRWRAQHVQDSHAACDRVCEWVRDLKEPDNPNTSCCAESDRYEADDYERGENGETIAIITDGKGEIKNGTKVPVPPHKYKWDKGNPTGKGQIFMRFDPDEDGNGDRGSWSVFCYVPGAGA